jgi:hypothetical protein
MSGETPPTFDELQDSPTDSAGGAGASSTGDGTADGSPPPGAGPDPGADSSTSLTGRVMNGLLETEPADEPAPGRDDTIEHVRIGLKKFLNGMLDGADMGRGRTAAEDFALAAINTVDDSADGGAEGGGGGGADVADVDTDRLGVDS